MTETQVIYANVASNVVGLGILLVSWRRRTAGRALFVALFLWAAQTNLRIALTHPEAYLDYARWAIPPYRRFILGPFAAHVTPIVAAIAAGQLAVGLMVAARGRAAAAGLGGAVTFLLAIAPLGRGAGFPFSLTVSAAAILLMARPIERTLPAEVTAWVRARRRRRAAGAPGLQP